MKAAIPTADEDQRQDALDALHIVHSPAEERFDRITRVACGIFQVPTALVSLVDREIQWFKSAQGLQADRTPRDISFCGHAIHLDEALVVEDASKHPDFADNPLVAGPLHLRFYAGHPLRYQGRKIGTLCLIDSQPRAFSLEDRQRLSELASWVEAELEIQAFSMAQLKLLETHSTESRDDLVDPSLRVWTQDSARTLWELQQQEGLAAPGAFLLLGLADPAALGEDADAIDSAMDALARTVLEIARPADILARQERDTLLAIWPDTLAQRAQERAQRIIDASGAGGSQVAIGLITLKPGQVDSFDALIASAGQALSRARADRTQRLIEI